MQHENNKHFLSLNNDVLENTFGGKKVLQRYMENGIIKLRIIEVPD